MTFTVRKKGHIVRIDYGPSGSTTSFSSGNNVCGVLPSAYRPIATLYFPALYLLQSSSVQNITYGAIYSNGNCTFYLTQAAVVRQMICGVTFIC